MALLPHICGFSSSLHLFCLAPLFAVSPESKSSRKDARRGLLFGQASKLDGTFGFKVAEIYSRILTSAKLGGLVVLYRNTIFICHDVILHLQHNL